MTAGAGRFAGKRAFVTGAASGIGAATVALLTDDGAQVVGADVATGGSDQLVPCDVRDQASVVAAMTAAIERLGGLDVCVNFAGINLFSAFEDRSQELLDRHLAVNLVGPMLVTQAALPHLRGSKGNVVTVASVSGLQGQPYNAAYCASKGGVLLLMRSLAVELASERFESTACAPAASTRPCRPAPRRRCRPMPTSTSSPA
jgi:meso-butanediol dehydrogenase / (S,S)-butanediol dehydrogenase / diacetyl reductase